MPPKKTHQQMAMEHARLANKHIEAHNKQMDKQTKSKDSLEQKLSQMPDTVEPLHPMEDAKKKQKGLKDEMEKFDLGAGKMKKIRMPK